MTQEIKKKDRLLYDLLAFRYGDEAQIDVAIEEMAELTKALLKLRRHYRSEKPHGSAYNLIDNIAEEMADVQIMMEQITVMMDKAILNFPTRVAIWREGKLQEQRERMQRVGL